MRHKPSQGTEAGEQAVFRIQQLAYTGWVLPQQMRLFFDMAAAMAKHEAWQYFIATCISLLGQCYATHS
jgi:hypothetical protein